MNIVILIGRLVRDPRYSNGVTKFTIAVDRQPDADGNKKADFIGITVFGKQAESCKQYLHTGRQVAVQASIRTDSYTDKDGKTIYTTEVIARRVQFMDERVKTNTDPNESEAQPQPKRERQETIDPYGYEEINEDIPF